MTHIASRSFQGLLVSLNASPHPVTGGQTSLAYLPHKILRVTVVSAGALTKALRASWEQGTWLLWGFEHDSACFAISSCASGSKLQSFPFP